MTHPLVLIQGMGLTSHTFSLQPTCAKKKGLDDKLLQDVLLRSRLVETIGESLPSTFLF